MPSPGFYLIYDAWDNSLAAILQLPHSSISWFSYRAIGSGAAVLRHGPPSDYFLAEFSLHLSHPVSKSVLSKDYSISLGLMLIPDNLRTSRDPSHVKPPYKAKYPLISVVPDDLIYLNITDMPEDYYVTLYQGMVVDSSRSPRSRLGYKFVSSFSMFLNKVKTYFIFYFRSCAYSEATFVSSLSEL